MKADDARVAIETCIAEAASADARFTGSVPTVEWTGFYAERYVLEEGTDAENVLRDCHRIAFKADLQSFTTPACLDARVFVIYGDMPTLVYGPLSKDIHGFDERVHLESVRLITKAIALLITDWCGVEPA